VTALSMSREECKACWASRADGNNEPSSYNQMRRDRFDFLNNVSTD
jgi:hypothetical protein